MGWVIRAVLRSSGINAESASIRPRCLSAPDSRRTPPSELIVPPSKATVTFFLQMFGKENGSSVLSPMAGMADPVRSSRVAFTPNLYAIPDGCAVPVYESLLCDE